MGSSQQIIVSGFLLVGAFLFGRYVTQPPDIGSNPRADAAVPSGPDRAASPLPASATSGSDETLQQKLRDKILGERAQRDGTPKIKSDSVTQSPSSHEQSPTALTDAIVAPDFSHLETGQLALPAPPSRSSVESPFESPFKTAVTDPRSTTSPVRPPRTLDETQSPFESSASSQPPAWPPWGTPRSEPGTAILDRAVRLPPSAAARSGQPPAPDVPTRRGRLRIGQPADRPPSGSFVPVQTRDSRLTLNDRKFVDYTTVFGDSLHSLSIKFFGSPDYYLDIYLANRDVLPNPSDIPLNTRLKIPVLQPSVHQE